MLPFMFVINNLLVLPEARERADVVCSCSVTEQESSHPVLQPPGTDWQRKGRVLGMRRVGIRTLWSMLWRCLGLLLVGEWARKWFIVRLETQFSPPVAFWGSVALTVLAILTAMRLWFPAGWRWLLGIGFAVRRKMGRLRWALLVVVVVSFPYVLLYSPYRTKFTDLGVRWLLFLDVALLAAFFYAPDGARELTFRDVLVGLVLTGSAFAFLSAYVNVSSYPFSLSWSEGNRLWDYSMRFARGRYNYPLDQPVFVHLDPGRQILWGLIFLIPGVGIFWVRFWSAFLFTVPYVVFSWAAFSQPSGKRWLSFLAGLWGFMFLQQGPIYTPLLLSALLVVVAERLSSVWGGAALMALAGYYAGVTRFTWLFAPALWAVILALEPVREESQKNRWRRAALLAGGGLLGALLSGRLNVLWEIAIGVLGKYGAGSTVASGAGGSNLTTAQPLIWSRLWPNPTFAPGILLGALMAVGPLVLLWFLWRRRRLWEMSSLELMIVLGILLSFFAVGVLASLKIGGGDNLHNLDMFLIGMLLVGVVFWRQGGRDWLLNAEWTLGEKIVLSLLVVMPVVFVLPAQVRRIPAERKWSPALAAVQTYVREANQSGGEILFMDQRQLLTFGFVDPVPLVPEYEKKYMMDQAMAGNAAYFAKYYQDLARARFAVIISEPLNVHHEQEGAEGFAAEGNAWVKWVSAPTLCYYRPAATFRQVRVQILVPRSDVQDCQRVLPQPLPSLP